VSGAAHVPAPGRLLRARAAETPDAPALGFGDDWLSYRELDRRARALASALAGLGVRPGDVVGALLDNGVALPVLFWALHGLGAVLLPLSWRLTADELAHPIGDARPVLLVHGDGERAEQARALVSAAPGLARARLDASGRLADVPGAIERVAPPDPLLDGAMALLYTSGTTGPPKGAVLGAEAFLASARASARLIGADARDRWLVCMPLFHVGGLSILVRSCLAGGRALIHARFDAEAVDRALDRDGVTRVSWVATMLDAVLAVRGARPAPPALRCALLGGGPTPAALLERAWAIGLPVAPTYGLTEAASQVATRAPDDREPPVEGRLRTLPGTRVRVVDESGQPVAAGAPGEIVVAGGTLMRGYLRRPDATARTLRDGWLHTGDVGVLDAAGRLAVLDRRDDLIVSGGENIYPAEIEATLLAHPAVAEAGVTGAPDPRFGARPVAFWVPADPASESPDLDAFCRARLAPFKVPVAFHRCGSLPRNAAGKLLRRALRPPTAPPAP
jgi:O-succinylbenzoic acid--CoA ligase